jgi:hypothetical protein
MNWDEKLYSPEVECFAECKNSNLNEELGR